MHQLPPLSRGGGGSWELRPAPQRDQLVEGSALGVPRDEVGLGEQ